MGAVPQADEERDGFEDAAILVADDEPIILRTVSDTLRDRGLVPVLATDGAIALAHLAERPFDVVITDLRMAGADGMQVLEAARSGNPHCCVILMTAFGSIQHAIGAIQRGAYQYLAKPFELAELMVYVDRCLHQRELRAELDGAREQLRRRGGGVGPIIARSAPMKRLLVTASAVAKSDAGVLLLGESGTGKEVLARAIHETSARADGPLVAVNCSAIPEALAEAELFGARRGAYTGATARDGHFVSAAGGTIFLDEVADLSPAVQAKLLRVLEAREVQPLGSDRTRAIDVRVIAATHRDLASMVEVGDFRDDLYFRLNVVPLFVPPLRDRRDDISLLAGHFLRQFGGGDKRISPEVQELLDTYTWPGNVRELQNVIHRGVVMAPGAEIKREHLPAAIRQDRPPPSASEPVVLVDLSPLATVVADAERAHIKRTLAATSNNRTEAAKALAISRKHLWHKMKLYGL